MSALTERYLNECLGDRRTAAANFARDLMFGNPDELKQGYSQSSALLTAFEMFQQDGPPLSDLDKIEIAIDVAERTYQDQNHD